MGGALRLDTDLWTPTALGCVGPGELAGVALGQDVLYRPLLALHEIPPSVVDGDEGMVEVVAGAAAWDRLCAEPEVVMADGGRSHLRDDPDAIVVAVRHWPGHGLRAVLALRPDRLEPRVAEVVMAWSPEGDDVGDPRDPHQGVPLGWLALFRAAAERGIVGVTVDVTHTGARRVEGLRTQIGLRPVADVYAEVGLGAPDALVEVDHWSATVAPSGEVDVRLARRGIDPTALTELAGRLHRLLRVRPDAEATPVDPVRLSGAITVDGCRGWTSHIDGDEAGFARARAGERCVLAWAEAHR